MPNHAVAASPRRPATWTQSAGIFACCLAVTAAAAGFGTLFAPDAWYRNLVRPPLAPPNWVFGPVWTTLYTLMAIAAGIVWSKAGWPRARLSLALYLAQLGLNAAWTALFFGLHRPDLALVEIVVLWLSIVATIAVFRRYSAVAAVMLVPYLAWVTFATYLNAGFWWLN